ncbi:MAG: hypothetical protein EYC62_00650 [Alphaproteobacteria bacterium]|nr:MAG: hypothetical protein EYC62_00650 [Alphaproteobacteria bacterium]
MSVHILGTRDLLMELPDIPGRPEEILALKNLITRRMHRAGFMERYGEMAAEQIKCHGALYSGAQNIFLDAQTGLEAIEHRVKFTILLNNKIRLWIDPISPAGIEPFLTGMPTISIQKILKYCRDLRTVTGISIDVSVTPDDQVRLIPSTQDKSSCRLHDFLELESALTPAKTVADLMMPVGATGNLVDLDSRLIEFGRLFDYQRLYTRSSARQTNLEPRIAKKEARREHLARQGRDIGAPAHITRKIQEIRQRQHSKAA